jgi:Transposase IS116/IS110/IS902 family
MVGASKSVATGIESLNKLIAEAMKAHQNAVVRLAEVPGLGIDSAHQIIAEIGPYAAAFPSAAQLASWVGVCPGRQESGGVSNSDRSAKGKRSYGFISSPIGGFQSRASTAVHDGVR